MILVNPITGGEVETFTDEATKHLISCGFRQKVDEQPQPKPKRTSTRKRTVKKEQ